MQALASGGLVSLQLCQIGNVDVRAVSFPLSVIVPCRQFLGIEDDGIAVFQGRHSVVGDACLLDDLDCLRGSQRERSRLLFPLAWVRRQFKRPLCQLRDVDAAVVRADGVKPLVGSDAAEDAVQEVEVPLLGLVGIAGGTVPVTRSRHAPPW